MKTYLLSVFSCLRNETIRLKHKITTACILPGRHAYELLVVLFFTTFFNCTKINEYKNTGTDDAAQVSSVSTDKLNIILIVIDDIGYEVPTYTGGQSYSTPVMDSLAAAGMQFKHCYASAMCSPSRVTLLTGRYGFRNYKSWGVLDTAQKTIANMLQDHGYKTCVSGKWQLDGGDNALHKFGFGKYSVFDPFDELPRSNDSKENKFRYKNPVIYQDGGYLPDSLTKGKFSDDMFTKYACNFMQKNTSNPFFIYFSFSECHKPFSPPPNHPDYAAWNPLTGDSKVDYYPYMVSYMDQKIGVIVNKVKALGIENKTMIFIISDNGSPYNITSKYKGRVVKGSKGETNEFGMHVPMIAAGPGVLPGSKNKNIIDFTDFFPTFAHIGKVSDINLKKYGIIDGKPFDAQFADPNTTGRSWSYGYFFPLPPFGIASKRVYVQDINYKLYDKTNNNNFYNIRKDSLEIYPLPDSALTVEQKITKQKFKNVLATMHN